VNRICIGYGATYKKVSKVIQTVGVNVD